MENKKKINLRLPKSKRLRFCVFAFITNAIIFLYGVHMKADLTALGTGLSLLNIPIISYVLGDTMRPSDKKTGQYG